MGVEIPREVEDVRTHIALSVSDLDASVRFYEVLLGAPPWRRLPGYAQFVLDDPGLNLALTQVDAREEGRSTAAPQHFGIEVESTAAVWSALQRVRDGGIPATVEEDTLCCYSRQDKFWVVDPDGHRWEVFFVSQRQGEPGPAAAGARRLDGAPESRSAAQEAFGEGGNRGTVAEADPRCCGTATETDCCAACCAG
ncbi:MAG TPA: ArsI/CadI family heavy metal resistance metalloenzyme [Gemmataceae bacterium]